ncbi:MAG: DEAD/DEAH box helicase [Nanoarchaeota archaeon]|nr:DEAD/DEAH box helicase [Nanoarchaeota archaeon]MBU1103157.1 DEAD/DEAH box helicase [Nanoarchaeota archaeon]
MEEISLSPRDYQSHIFNTAKDNNTLVVLPTGLGKTLVALLLSVHRLKAFPTSKILFLAPTRPLVEQHFQTYKKNLSELFADLQLFTGEVPAKQRKKTFQTADIIFSTPQCIANDLRSCLYTLHEVSLLIIDEAHRCLKNYDYTKVVDYYKQQGNNKRILGLTASPGSSPENVKEICKHLAVDEIEVRTRDSQDVKPYLQELEFEKILVPFPSEFLEIKLLLKKIFDAQVAQLRNRNLLFGPANKITLLKLQGQLGARYQNARDFNAMRGMSLTATAIKISHALELLETQTLSGLHEYLKNLQKQASEKKSKAVQSLVKSQEFNAAFILLQNLLTKKVEHPKIEETVVLVENQFKENPNSKVIIFAQFRETGVKITERLNKIKDVNAMAFFGQAKKNNVGLSQKEQKQIIQKLNSGEINTIVATSIGEEGLDIAEVSTVIFYEPIPSAIRKIQRQGRTARLAPGKLIILITKDTRDVPHHYASKAREKKMYQILDDVKKELEENNKIKTLEDFK